MSEDQIVSKLRKVLSEPIKHEKDVVYILCEVRKLMDRKNPVNPSLFALRSHCHWALHVDLAQPKTTLPFLTRVEKYVESVLAGNTDVAEESRMHKEFVSLDTFRQQFLKLLTEYQLPLTVCTDDDEWKSFVDIYAHVIEDGSLTCGTNHLKLVKKVTFTKDKNRPIADASLFVKLWNIQLVDGRRLEVTVTQKEFPNKTPMYIWGIKYIPRSIVY